MKVMIFGGTGYIGSRIWRRLMLDSTMQVYGIGGRNAEIGVESSIDLSSSDLSPISYLVGKIQPDVVVNCAGTISANTIDCIASHVVATGNILTVLSRKAKSARFIQLGSAAEYGQALTYPGQINELTPPNPKSSYGVSKLASTLLASTYAECSGVQSMALRIFNLLGPNMKPGTIIPSVINFLSKPNRDPNENFEAGNLGVYRDFVHIDDVCSAITAALKSPNDLSGVILNIASSKPVFVRELVRRMLDAGGHKGEIRETLANTRSNSVIWQHADISSAARLISWKPEKDIIEEALSYATQAVIHAK